MRSPRLRGVTENQMNTFFYGVGLAAVVALAGCGQKETPAPKTAPAVAPTMPNLTSAPAVPPPPGAPTAAAVVPAAPADVPTYEGKDEVENLNQALRDYYTRNGAAAPMVTSFETLVKARVLKSVPVPPAGKKYVIDTKKVEIRLENL